MTECPARRDFWRGEVDARTPAAFRISVGTVLLVSLLDRLPDVRFLYTNDGVAPLSAIHVDWRSWSLLQLGGEPAFVFLVYLLGLACVVAFTLGYRTRLATVLTWLFLVSLDHRSRIALDNGENA